VSLDFRDKFGRNHACTTNKAGVIVIYSIALVVGVIGFYLAMYRLWNLYPFKLKNFFELNNNHMLFAIMMVMSSAGVLGCTMVIAGYRMTRDIFPVILWTLGILCLSAFNLILTLRLMKVVRTLPGEKRNVVFWFMLLKTVSFLSAFFLAFAGPLTVYIVADERIRYFYSAYSGAAVFFSYGPQIIIAFSLANRIITGLKEGAKLSGDIEIVQGTIDKLTHLRRATIIPLIAMIIIVSLMLIFIILLDYIFALGFILYSVSYGRIVYIVLAPKDSELVLKKKKQKVISIAKGVRQRKKGETQANV